MNAVERVAKAGLVSVTITPNIEPAIVALNDMARELRRAKRAADSFASRWNELTQDAMGLGTVRRRAEVRRAGREAKWYVRGGLDPAYASEAARDAEVRRLLDLGNVGMAVAFSRGWAVHRNGNTETGRWVGTWMGQSRSFVTPTSGERA